MLLSKLFKGAPDIEIDQLSTDSRLPMNNAIFFCLNGIKYDGHDYIGEAVRNGAKVIVYSKSIEKQEKAVYIKVANVNQALNKIANIFFEHPNQGMDEYVICGNYGRCSVASFINYYLNRESSCGYIGILGIRYERVDLKTSFPTLNALENLKTLQTMKKSGVRSCTFEANASSLYLQKLDGLKPGFFIYTNTSRGSSEYRTNDYYNCIRKYLYTLEDDTVVVLNADDESLKELNECVDNYVTYGTSTIADYQIRDITVNTSGISYRIVYEDKSYPIKASLQGLCNVYNLTAAIAALHQKGHQLEDLIAAFAQVPYVEGVMEKADPNLNVIIDCAYDLDSMETIFRYAETVKRKNKAIGVISVNYTDGKSRLEKMIRLCEKYLDVIILTENETLEGEIMSILERCDSFTDPKSRIVHCALRSLAIENAIDIMNDRDIVLIIGKGNEKFLSMGLGKEFYNGDRYYAVKYIEKRRREKNETSEVY